MKNSQKLGNIIIDRMTKTSNAAVPLTVDLGTINRDLSLTTDRLKGKIPKEQYLVDINLTHKTYMCVGSGAARLPKVFRKLEKDDRVLVIWVGHEPVVVAIVVSGDTESIDLPGLPI